MPVGLASVMDRAMAVAAKQERLKRNPRTHAADPLQTAVQASIAYRTDL